MYIYIYTILNSELCKQFCSLYMNLENETIINIYSL